MIQRVDGENPEENADFRTGAAQGAAVGAAGGPFDANLQRVIDAWPILLDDIKAAVLALVDSADEDDVS